MQTAFTLHGDLSHVHIPAGAYIILSDLRKGVWARAITGSILGGGVRGDKCVRSKFHFTPAFFPGHTLEESGSKSAHSFGSASVRSSGIFMQTFDMMWKFNCFFFILSTLSVKWSAFNFPTKEAGRSFQLLMRRKDLSFVL